MASNRRASTAIYRDFSPASKIIRAPFISADTSFDDVSPRLGARFAWSDSASVYATVSKGYKAGGTSTGHDPQ